MQSLFFYCQMQKYRVKLFQVDFATKEGEMRHLLLITGILISSISTVFAGETAIISLTDGIVTSKDREEAKETAQEFLDAKARSHENLQKGEEKEEKKGGFLSFMNFSFLDDDKTKDDKAQKQETQEEYMDRMFSLAESGDVSALLNLGYMYIYGQNGLEMNYKKAFEYYRLAADQGNDVALNNLGSMYYGGVGIKKDVEKAAQLFAQASDLGNIDASLSLAMIYLTEGTAMYNDKAAIQLLKKVAETNNPTGKYLLGYAYLKGIGVPQNKTKAIKNIRFAADKNYDEAQYIMGYLYERGFGIPQNYNNAMRYFMRAANQGNVSAMNELGELYALGNRITADYYKAYIMYNLLAYYGVPGAEKRRDILGTTKLKTPELLQAQTEAESFTPQPSKLTQDIRTKFGDSLALYVDKNAPIIVVKKDE